MESLFQTLAFLLALTSPLAGLAWVILWTQLQQAKRRHLTAEERQDPTHGFRLPFLFTEAMRADPTIRRLRFWTIFAFFWFPVAATAFAVIKSFFIPQSEL